MAHILDHAGPSSLVVIDELGRATSTTDGVAIAWAVSEELIANRVPTLFATHFEQLMELPAMYPSAKLWRLQVGSSESTWRRYVCVCVCARARACVRVCTHFMQLMVLTTMHTSSKLWRLQAGGT